VHWWGLLAKTNFIKSGLGLPSIMFGGDKLFKLRNVGVAVFFKLYSFSFVVGKRVMKDKRLWRKKCCLISKK